MVSLFNGSGSSMCVALISVVEFSHYNCRFTGSLFNGLTLTIILGTIIGCVFFLRKYYCIGGKLEGKIKIFTFLQTSLLISYCFGNSWYLRLHNELAYCKCKYASHNLWSLIDLRILFVFPIGELICLVVHRNLIHRSCGGSTRASSIIIMSNAGGILVGSSGNNPYNFNV